MYRRLVMSIVAVCMLVSMTMPAFAAASSEAWPSKIRVGFIPTEGNADIKKRFAPLTDHLQEILGIEVEAFSASDYAGIITAMTHKHIDFAYFGPKSYTEAAEKAGAQALIMELNKQGQPGYTGIIIVRKDSNMQKLSDIKGKVFAFTDPNSTSGYLVPNVLFARDLNVKPEAYFKQVKFSGSHGASILAVKNKGVEVAATNNIDLDRMIEKGQVSMDDFRILWRSELIPGAPMAARRDMPESLKAAFTGAMLMFNANKAGVEKLQNGGYQFTSDSTYDIIRYLKRLKKELAAK
ncbi:phosphonate ABC transporter substrate-binding protein [Halodesulfovibrio marinisediminis]|uniref:Phosphonate transport system substrate-binding protein n=1 Tax=Halodesulfovibrio marinisediminis DSM 17456 TaxID=1121457 RepID=A0A1N6DWV3_9BACT|nr:phosphonate ABC transporter substrate-binding protein [Halodesulfovibrio marinisediminis]SIN75231.1 phosphonate transport system substrate-binding protein [Halodesulfovibrio marinisediminis DSM 17456]